MATARERLIETASRLFYQHGFHAVGLDRIIAEVGVTKTTFYNHFESKDELILAVLERRDTTELAEWLRIMRERGDGSPRAQLLALFDILEEWFSQSEFRGCMFINAATEFPIPHDPIHRAAAAHGQHLGEAIGRIARQAGASDADVLSERLMLLVSGAIVARHVAQAADAARTARATAALIVDHHLPPAEVPA